MPFLDLTPLLESNLKVPQAIFRAAGGYVADRRMWKSLAVPGYTSHAIIETIKPCRPRPTNCKNCAAPLRSSECEYCNTVYA